MVRPQILKLLHGPTESEQIELRSRSGSTTAITARFLDRPNRHSIKATDTSASEMVDVKAATESRRKNSDDQNCVPPI